MSRGSADLHHRSVAVVGGGVTGLTAARSLARRGATVALYEAGPRLGGQIRTVTVGGHRVDVGAEALHLASPPVRTLLDQLGVAGDVVTARPGTSWIWTGERLRRLPAGVGPAGPTRLGPVLRARVLSPRGLARAAVEPLVPRHAAHRDGRDMAVGALVAGRFGRQVADRLVDPLLGNLHAGDVSRLSVRATTPQLAAQAARHRSLLLARRGRGRGAPPSFVSFPGGLTTLTEALLADVAVEVHLGAPVAAIARVGHRYRVEMAAGAGSAGGRDHDAVVLAVPFDAAAALLGPMALGAAARLTAMRSASVVTVVAAYPRAVADAAPALAASGVLVTSTAGRLLKAATFLTSKWPHLDDPDVFLVRLSAGRAGSTEVSGLTDDQLVERLHADLADATGLATRPTDALVTRWPRALPQLEVGHVERTEAIRGQLRGLHGLVLAGASYEGLGLAACIGSGERAAEAVSAHLVARGRPAVTG